MKFSRAALLIVTCLETTPRAASKCTGADANCRYIVGGWYECEKQGCEWESPSPPTSPSDSPPIPSNQCTALDECDGPCVCSETRCETTNYCSETFCCFEGTKCKPRESCFDAADQDACEAEYNCRWEGPIDDSSDDDDGFFSCFPQDALVRVSEAGTLLSKTMDDLHPGDQVEVLPGVFEPILFFSHSKSQGNHTFVALVTDKGTKVRLSGSHYVNLWDSAQLVAARTIQVGDKLDCAGTPCLVERIQKETGVGLYAPHTPSGVLLVNGVSVSSYTEALPVAVAHSLVTMYRAFSAFGLSRYFLDPLVQDLNTETGYPWLAGAYLSVRNGIFTVPSAFYWH